VVAQNSHGVSAIFARGVQSGAARARRSDVMRTTNPHGRTGRTPFFQRVRCAVLAALAFALCLAVSPRAEAQLQQGALRFSLDTDFFTAGGVRFERDGADSDVTVFGFGPNHLGNTAPTGYPMALTGLGFGYALRSQWVLGLRTGLAFDVYDGEGASDKTRVLGLSLMPGVTWLPIGRDVKLFVNGSPILQVNRQKQGDASERLLLGGFSFGVGALIFPVSAFSFDAGFHFEGRFGNDEDDNDNRQHIRDLRGVIRLGVSLWR
jgi:hypothetical protein